MKDRTRAARRRVVDKTPARPPKTNANKWYRIDNLVDRPSTAAIYIYDVIGCTCWWDDVCNCVTAKNLIDDLQGLNVDNLHIHINSPGGEVDDGIAIYNTLRNHPARKTTFIDSLAASAASFIALASDEVVIAETGQVMIHDASGIQIGNADDMREFADLLDRYSNNIAGIYSRKSGMSVEACRELMRAETWFTGSEAVTAGLADRTDEQVVDDRMEDRMTARHNLSLFAFRYAGRDKAPAPVLTNHVEPEQVEPEPAVEPTPEPDDVPPVVEAAVETEAVEDVQPADESIVAPAVFGSPQDETEHGEVEDTATTADDVEPEPVEPSVAAIPEPAPEPEPAPAATDTDPWAQLISPLLSATPASPTWDDVFAQLTKP